MAVIQSLAFILLASICASDAKLRFASYYGDHMVLQKAPERAVLWGYGPEGAQVTLYLKGQVDQKTSPVTVTKGIWKITLDPVEAGGPYTVIAVAENDSAVLTDVLFGDVWLCGGQSNMSFEMYKIFNALEELKIAEKYPHVRTFMASMKTSETELIDLIQVELPWSVPPATLAQFSAVCWLFGRNLFDKLQYPIGLVESCWGGTRVEIWSSSRALQKCGILEEANSSLPAGLCGFIGCGHGEEWYERQTEAPPPIPLKNSVLWNSMIHPLLNMTIKGAIWYQGEANTIYQQDKYNCSFPAMIGDWRMAFHQGSGGETAPDFPFGFVQLSTNRTGSKNDSFPEIRWHQTADVGYVPNARMPKTFMAVALDLPDKNSPYGRIHPRDKQDVAYRLSLAARAVAYNEVVSYQGPFPTQVMATQTDINITYDQKVSVTSSKDIFEICCTENQAPCGNSSWIPAPIMQWDATTVTVSTSLCPPTDQVVALRYAWSDWPCDFKACPIYSADGILPAPPFIVSRPQPKRQLKIVRRKSD
ncbi:sialate O-acetylesterase-like isoform X2 [Centropristis striata]|uniref:sialate O-acetylesterase-like isoform X2 n=1 Tax=Centropristis striata TaxID=184440 RepID=UPI0027DEE431|nr:sialate O-acetylesterase-like isoform X2 [Centropristis striata]